MGRSRCLQIGLAALMLVAVSCAGCGDGGKTVAPSSDDRVEEPGKQPPSFWEYVVHVRPFDDNYTLVSGGLGGRGGTVLLTVNGNPVEYLPTIGPDIRIGHYLRRGKNTVALVGELQSPLILGVGRKRLTVAGEPQHMQEQELQVLCKKAIAHDAPASERAVTFDADIDYDLPIYSPGSVLEPSDDLKREVLREMTSILQIFDTGKGIEKLYEGTAMWSKAIMGKSFVQEFQDWVARDLSAAEEDLLRHFVGRATVPKKDDLQVIFGPNIALVYYMPAGRAERLFPGAVVRVMVDGHAQRNLGPFILAKIEGRWVVWDDR